MLQPWEPCNELRLAIKDVELDCFAHVGFVPPAMFGEAAWAEGEVLESFVTKKRGKVAALKFMKKAMKRFGNPEAITTDGLRSYKAAMTELGNADKQQIGR